MKVKYNKKENKVEYGIEERDLLNVLHLEEMLRGQVTCKGCGTVQEIKGWDVLSGYMQSTREIMIEAGKDGTKTKADRAESDLKFSKLDGYDSFMRLPERIILKAQIEREAQNQQEVVKNATRHDQDQY